MRGWAAFRTPGLALCLVLGVAPLAAPIPAGTVRSAVDDGLDAIDTADVTDHLEFLASDELEGRNTPMRGLDLAAAYIADRVREFGLEPVSGEETPYFHQWGTQALKADPICSLSLHTPGNDQAKVTYTLGDDFVPAWVSGELEVQAPVVFAGYGITARKERYDDYGGKSIHDKIALVLSHEPRQKARGKRFEGPAGTKYSSLLEKAKNAAEHGAKGLLVVSNPTHHEYTGPMGYQLPRMPDRGRMRPRESAPIPVVSISLELAEEILGKKIGPLQKNIDRTLRNKLISAKGGEVRMRVKLEEGNVTTQNVAAFHRGSDPSVEDELIIIGAHYDHIGVRDDTGEVNNGADDNGSGTAALLEIAEAFATSGIETRRSILFLWFSGEEKNLVGSNRYVEDPLYPLDKTIAMINLDMVGRNDGREIDVLGGKENPELLTIAKRAASNPRAGIKIEKGSQEFFKRSDHYPFHQQGIPVLFFFCKLHEDYHKPTDMPDKIDHKKITRVARTVFLTALHLANQD